MWGHGSFYLPMGRVFSPLWRLCSEMGNSPSDWLRRLAWKTEKIEWRHWLHDFGFQWISLRLGPQSPKIYVTICAPTVHVWCVSCWAVAERWASSRMHHLPAKVRNRSPFYPLKAEWWTKCNRSRTDRGKLCNRMACDALELLLCRPVVYACHKGYALLSLTWWNSGSLTAFSRSE